MNVKDHCSTSLQMVTLKDVQYKEEMITLEYHFLIIAKIIIVGNNYQ